MVYAARAAPLSAVRARRSALARLVLLQRLGRRALPDPFGPAAVDVRDVGHAHVLQRLGRERAAPAGAAEQDELLRFVGEDGLLVRGRRIDPALVPAAPRLRRAGDAAAREFAHVADV